MGGRNMSLRQYALDEHGLFVDKPGCVATYSGGRIDPINPEQDDISIYDIARGLSNACRWNGQCRFYSVAEHSVLCSYMVETLEALMHDASEGYINDMARPVKMATDLGRLYLEHEEVVERAIAERYGLTFPWPSEVKTADYSMGFSEAKILLPHLGELMPPVGQWTPDLQFWTPEEAYQAFLSRFEELGGFDNV